MITETHAAVTGPTPAVGNSLHASQFMASAAAAAAAAHAADVTAAAVSAAAAAARASAEAAADATVSASHPATWRLISPEETLPAFATNFQFGAPPTVRLLFEKYEIGHDPGGAAPRLPPVKHLEARYGPAVRSGKTGGFSWRSSHYRGSQRVDNAFSKRKRAFDVFDVEGKEGANRLEARIQTHFGAEYSPSWTQVPCTRLRFTPVYH
jgi:hypothetical protein